MVKKWTPVKSILLGAGVTTVGMFLNVLPPLFLTDLSQKASLAGLAIPVAGVFLIVSIASMAVGEMMASPRIYEYLGGIAPKGQEGLYVGYANLPIALASILGGPLGGRLFEIFISEPVKAGNPARPVPMWLIITGIGMLAILGLAVYDRLLGKAKK
jgi:hypothetical protein